MEGLGLVVDKDSRVGATCLWKRRERKPHSSTDGDHNLSKVGVLQDKGTVPGLYLERDKGQVDGGGSAWLQEHLVALGIKYRHVVS